MKTKNLNNMNTLNALIRDEQMAIKEYYDMSRDKNIPKYMREQLLKMSRDEANHRMALINYREKLRLKKLEQ